VFITLEGIDRSGKTTQAAMLADALGPDTLRLREPGGTPLGERVRALLMDPELELGSGSELLLFGAARAALAAQVIAPAKESGRDIVCDRFIDSTVAYQGVARGLGVELVEQLNSVVIGSCVPEITLLLRIDAEEAERRGQQRLAEGIEDGADRFEGEGLEFQQMVAAAYDDLAARHSARIVVIDASGNPADVHERIMEEVGARRGR
jgi:dTMP kinase